MSRQIGMISSIRLRKLFEIWTKKSRNAKNPDNSAEILSASCLTSPKIQLQILSDLLGIRHLRNQKARIFQRNLKNRMETATMQPSQPRWDRFSVRKFYILINETNTIPRWTNAKNTAALPISFAFLDSGSFLRDILLTTVSMQVLSDSVIKTRQYEEKIYRISALVFWEKKHQHEQNHA